MPKSHYYDRETGHVIKRLPQNPEKKRGSTSGRKQRNTDKTRGVYPRGGLPISREGRSEVWIKAYQGAYYQTVSMGRPMLGDSPKVTISVTASRSVIDAVDGSPHSRSECFEAGAKLLLGRCS